MALECINRGMAPIPVPLCQKAPTVSGWNKLRVTKETLDTYFPEGSQQKIGVLLGEPSGGLVDIDCDWPEAARLAPYFLPSTNAVFGRKSNPNSHWMYICKPAPKTTQFQFNVK